MDSETLQAVVDEILPILENKRIGKIFQIAANRLAIDFRPGDGRYLFLNFEPRLVPRLYLVRRRVRELEKQSEHPGNFVLFVRKRLSDARLRRISKDENDRVARFEFLAEADDAHVQNFTLVAQLTGRAANLFLLDAEANVLESLRETFGAGQQVGEKYSPPVFETKQADEVKKSSLIETISNVETAPSDYEFAPPSPVSERLDRYFQQIETGQEFEALALKARNRFRQELIKKERLIARLTQDLTAHGEPEELKKSGDLLLANARTARRVGKQIFVTDFYADEVPEIAIEADENLSLPEAAEKFFARYTKARNARQELTKRIADVKTQIEDLQSQQANLETIINGRDIEKLSDFFEKSGLEKAKPDGEQRTKQKKEPETFKGARRYRSSDGLEILVGRAAKDNDLLTFRVAKSLDWWLHAADYSGSHVVVRNPSRAEQLPQKTLLEAAQLAAKFSQAKQDSKVAVHYTQRKFVSKPKNAAPGLVRLASFRTILVEPKESAERI